MSRSQSQTRPRLTLILMLLAATLLLPGCGYNDMQRLDEAVNRAWGDLEAQLQRRADLIPNLVETVRGYAAHERETLTSVIEARSKATQIRLDPKELDNPESMARFQAAQGELSQALGRLLAVAERYPALKADQSFRDLQHQLEGSENRISVARQRYNEAVEAYNYSIRSFPNSLTNSLLLHLDRREFYKADEAARQVPQVKF